LSTVVCESPPVSTLDSFRTTSVTRYSPRRRTIIVATSDCLGVQPVRVAVGWTTTATFGSTAAASSPVVEASAVWIQLPSGMTRASSRIRRSQSKRVSATPATVARRTSLIAAKSTKAACSPAWASRAAALALSALAWLLLSLTLFD